MLATYHKNIECDSQELYHPHIRNVSATLLPRFLSLTFCPTLKRYYPGGDGITSTRHHNTDFQ